MARVSAVTDVTFPLAKLIPAPLAPEGTLPGGAPEPLDGKVPGGFEPEKPWPPPGKPLAQLPDDVGWLMVTDLAVMAPFEVDPVTVTQSPVATVDAATVAVWVKVVEGVQVTVTCPDCWFWTSMDDPEMAATDPEAPGNEPPPAPPGARAEPAAAVVVTVVLLAVLLLPPPQAPRTIASATLTTVAAHHAGGRVSERFMS
jgi:hypothetical protein